MLGPNGNMKYSTSCEVIEIVFIRIADAHSHHSSSIGLLEVLTCYAGYDKHVIFTFSKFSEVWRKWYVERNNSN